MKTLNIRSLLSALTLALVLLLGTGSTFTTALAEETQGKISQEQLDKLAKASPEDREKVRTTAVDKYTQEFCSKIADDAVNLPGQDKNQICKDEIGANINRIIDTPEKGVKGEIDLQQICGAAGSEVSNWGLKKRCISDSVQKVLPAALKATAAGLMVNPTIAGIINAGKAAEKVTEYIKDAKDPFEMLVNHAHEEAVTWTVKVMDTATGSTDFDPTQTWFTTSWAGAAGVGILLMGIMFLLMLKDLGNGDIDEDEFRNSLLRWGPAAVLMATFGPALMGKLTSVMSALNSGVITARGDDLTSRIIDFVNTLAVLDSGSGLGPLLMIIIFIVMIIAALMLYVVFLVQHFALIMLAYGIAIMLGALMNPKWRPGLLKAASTWITVLFSKTVLLIMMALIFTIDFASIAPDDGLQILSQTVIVILAMGAVAFSPMILLKYVPMVSSPGAVTMPSGPAVASYTGGGAGSHSETTYMNEQVTRGNEKASAPAPVTTGASSTGAAGAGAGAADAGSSSGASASTGGGATGFSSAAPVSSTPAASGSSSSGAPADSTATGSNSNTAQASETSSAAQTSPAASTAGSNAPAVSGASTGTSAGSAGSVADTSGDTGAIDAGEDYSSVKPSTADSGFTPAGSPVTGGSPAAGSPALAPASAPASTPAAAGTSSGAASGSGASGATASGGGAAAGGAFAGVLLAAAATKKAADTGKDTLVGLNAEAANFQDYNSDTQPEGR